MDMPVESDGAGKLCSGLLQGDYINPKVKEEEKTISSQVKNTIRSSFY